MNSTGNQPMTDEEARDLLQHMENIPDLEGYLKATNGMWPFEWAVAAVKRASQR